MRVAPGDGKDDALLGEALLRKPTVGLEPVVGRLVEPIGQLSVQHVARVEAGVVPVSK